MAFPVSSQPALEPLTQALGHFLQAANPSFQPTRLDCQRQQGRLLIMAFHLPPQAEDPAALLRQVKTAFFEMMPEVGLPDGDWADGDWADGDWADGDWASLQEIPVRLGLQLEGQPAPYATHTFTWRLEDAIGVIFEAPDPEAFPAEFTEVASEIDSRPALSGPAEAAPDDASEPGAEAADDAPVARHLPPAPPPTSPPPPLPNNDAALALPETAVDPPAALLVQRWGQWSLGQLQRLRPYGRYALLGLIGLSGGLFVYTVSRPCVLGRCDRLDQAAALQQAAQSRIGTAPTAAELQTAKSELQAALDLTAPVPHWSRHYGEAQASTQAAASELNALKAISQAQASAYAAALKSQDPPHPVKHWVDIAYLWRQAIAALEQVPPTSAGHDYAQAKLAEYKTQLAAINHRVAAEEAAEASLTNALQAAQLAQQRIASAGSLQSWQVAMQQWQVAVLQLRRIPQGTEAYSQAQRSLQAYQGQLAQAQYQVSREGSAASSYEAAQAAAREAAAREAQNQWTQAVEQWKIALNTLQQVPPTSALAAQAEQLLPTYRAALARSQAQLRTAIALQQLQARLGPLCSSRAAACQITAGPDQIQVRLAGPYAQALTQAITPPAEGAPVVPAALSRDAQQIVEQIVLLGNQVQRPIAVYSSQGELMVRYRPDLGGFVQE